ncbi:hypothetical protein GALMADRAFT_144577 [Galerina marginata CBS 339.88]|uniref:Transmembrane protein n=1 Tax=Galerina marginata (strain CBS 339.88) TaxID=685588 RepID=A0A067SIE8_GALM3|nr:hypothetical protein GALMADRAFT_144577 [Galerina marginata CBS 339.88]
MSLENCKRSSTLTMDTQLTTTIISRWYIPRRIIKLSIWVLLVVSCLIISLSIAPHVTVKPLKFQAPVPSSDDLFIPDVSLTAEVVSVNPTSRTVVMNWYPEFVSINCSVPLVLDIFVPVTLLDRKSASWSAQLDDQPALRLNSTESCLNLTPMYPSFQTVTKLITSKEYTRVQSFAKQPTFQSYPFDVYLAPFSFYTRNVQTGIIAAVKVSDSFGVAVDFQISLLNSFVVYNEFKQNLQFTLRIERGMGTKIIVLLFAIMIWLTAISFFAICTLACVNKSRRISPGIFVVPIAILLAYSTIRANLPGAPNSFGAIIDVYTILPVFVIMFASSFSVLLVILYQRIDCRTIGKHQDNQEGYSEDAIVHRFPTMEDLEIPDMQSRPLSDLTKPEHMSTMAI